MTKPFAGVLLLAALGCGGGGAAAPPAKPAAGAIEEEGAPKSTTQGGAAPAAAGIKIDMSLVPAPGERLEREAYDYGGTPRDPFASVLEGGSIGPELSDLDLVAVIYVERAHNQSVVVLHDRVSGKRYSVHEGERVGRARVSDIGSKDVSFTYDDYGTQRTVTLSLRKREDILP